MELSSTVFSDVLGPLAAFTRPASEQAVWEDPELLPAHEDPSTPDSQGQDWRASPLNPQSRIDSLTPSANPTWRIDGAHIDGTRFFAVPVFAVGRPPLRVDVHLPPAEEYPQHLRCLLRPEAAICSRRSVIPDLAVSQHLLRTLGKWSSRIPDFETQYRGLPFGSRILVAGLAANLDDADIHLLPDFDAEQAMPTLPALRQAWKSVPDASWPDALDWEELSLVKQLHETITLVTIPSHYGDRELVFKSLTRDMRHLYHELKVLIWLRPQDNIISKPLYIITRRCRFGGKVGVCGFILDYFPCGNLHDALALANTAAIPSPSLQQRFRWARQATQALQHIASHQPGGFYPDLKPDNLVLRPSTAAGTTDLVLLDFEQRGGWFAWSPPEVLYVEYLELLATGLAGRRNRPDVRARDEARRLLAAWIPGWAPAPAPAQAGRAPCVDAVGGYSAAWLALGREGGGMLERAQAFMLGKLLWCIFEGQAGVRCGVDHEVLRDGEGGVGVAFPEFRETPEGVRGLIRRCTAGAPEWEEGGRGRGVVLRGGRVVPFESRAVGGGEGERSSRGDVGVGETRKVVKEWWVEELDRAKRFVRELVARKRDVEGGPFGLIEEVERRPLLAEVLDELERIE